MLKIIQNFLRIVSRITISVILIKKKSSHGRLREDKKYIVISNHLSFFDPYIVIGNLSSRYYQTLDYVRFMTHNRFIDSWVGPFLRWSGSFPATAHQKYPFGLTAAKEFLEKGEAVMIFPEGGIVKPGKERRPRSGVSVLANEPDTMILPVHIRQLKKGTNIFGANKVFRNLEIIYGQPFSGKGMSPEQIMDRVYSLKP